MKSLESLLEFNRLWDKAIERNNVEEISGYMADDWVCVATDGGITSKEQFLGGIKSGALVHTTMRTDENTARIFDNTGIVVGKGVSSGLYQGNPFSFYEWSTSIFRWNDVHWKCVLTMLTPAKPDPERL